MIYLQQAGKIILFLSVLSFITMGFAPKLEANDIIYKGVSQCGGRQIEVSFVYDSSSSTIKNFKAIHSCVEEVTLHPHSGWPQEGP